MSTNALATHVMPQADGIVLRNRDNRQHFQQWLDRGSISGSGAFRKALRKFSEAVDAGNWEAVKLTIEYAIGKPPQFLASRQYDDDGAASVETSIEEIEHTVTTSRRRRLESTTRQKAESAAPS